MASKKNFHGVIPPIITPMTEDGKLDVEALEGLLEFLLDAGIDGVFLAGTSGEACYISADTQEELVRNTFKIVNGKVPVLCGVIEPSTVRCEERIHQLEMLGASLFVATPAFYLQNSCQDEIVRHYERLGHVITHGSLIAYNIPATTHVNILPETIRRIAQIDNLVMYKDSCANFEQIQRDIWALRDTHVSLFNGAEELCAAAMAFGAEGCVPGLANFFPHLFIDCCTAAQQGNIAKAIRLQEEIVQLREVLFIGKHWMAGMKYLASRFGFGSGAMAVPIQPLSMEEKRCVDQCIEKYR